MLIMKMRKNLKVENNIMCFLDFFLIKNEKIFFFIDKDNFCFN